MTVAARRSLARTPIGMWIVIGLLVIGLFIALSRDVKITVGGQPLAAQPAAEAPVAKQKSPSAVAPKKVCDDGFDEYSEGVRCRKMYAEVKPPAKSEPCELGTKKEVPDPARPGFTMFQKCVTTAIKE